MSLLLCSILKSIDDSLLSVCETMRVIASHRATRYMKTANALRINVLNISLSQELHNHSNNETIQRLHVQAPHFAHKWVPPAFFNAWKVTDSLWRRCSDYPQQDYNRCDSGPIALREISGWVYTDIWSHSATV